MSDISTLLNNKRVLLIAGVLLLLFVGLWFSPRTDNFGPSVVRSGMAVVPTCQNVPSVTPTLDGYDRVFSRAVGAFDCGSGNYVGAVEPGRPFTLITNRGDGWIEVDIQGSGNLCVKVLELVK